MMDMTPVIMLCWPRMNGFVPQDWACCMVQNPFYPSKARLQNKHPRCQSISCTIIISCAHAEPQECELAHQALQIFTTCLTVFLQTGQSWFCICLAHSSQALRCPQGKKIASISFSQQIWQNCSCSSAISNFIVPLPNRFRFLKPPI